MREWPISIDCEQCLIHHPPIIEAFDNLNQADLPHRTHYINGRFENLYVDPAELPGLQEILDSILTLSVRFSGHDRTELQLGFWLNAMQPGDSTSLHSHDDNDELLSGVYYLSVPANSGDLIIYYGEQQKRILPRAGLLVLFAPDIPHEVTQNQSDQLRLSLAFNIGLSGSV
jgi:hypothetical protein